MKHLLLVAILVGVSSALYVKSEDYYDYGSSAYETTMGALVTQGPTVGPTSPPSTYQGPGCGQCNYGEIWNDVIYILDGSEASGTRSIGDMWSFVLTATGWYNVQKTGTNGTMRVGVISYASTAQVLAPLGSVTADDMYNMDPAAYQGDTGTNIEAAISLATQQFNGTGHRANAKKVIVLMATTYNRGNYNAPQKAAETFIEDGGVLIVYDYVPNHGEPSPELKELASTGYFLYSPNSNITDFMNAQCDANCFCPPNFAPYGLSARKTPLSGCYYAVDIQNNFPVAKRNCERNYNNGYLASDQNANKTTFLQQYFNHPTNFLIGLTWDSSSYSWKWSDGTPLSGGYEPWYNGMRPSNDASGGCVYVSQVNNQWVPTDCRYGYYYTCESKPCSSTNYCEVLSV